MLFPFRARKNSGSHPEVDDQQAVAAGSGVQDINASAAGDFELTFEGQGLKLISAADAKVVVDKINDTQNFTTLTFSGNTVGIDAAEAIGKALENHPELKYAHWKDMFTGRMKTEISPALKFLRLVFVLFIISQWARKFKKVVAKKTCESK